MKRILRGTFFVTLDARTFELTLCLTIGEAQFKMWKKIEDSVSGVILIVVIGISAYFGNRFGGTIGAVLGAFAGFTFLALFAHIVLDRRTLASFWKCSRGVYVALTGAVIGAIVSREVGRHPAVFVGGIWGGTAAALWISDKLGLDDEVETSRNMGCIGIMKAISTADGESNEEDYSLQLDSATDLFATLGYVDKKALESFVEGAEYFRKYRDHQEFINELPRDWKILVLLHAIRMTYSQSPVKPARLDKLRTIFISTGLGDESLLALWDRNVNISQEWRENWLRRMWSSPLYVLSSASHDHIRSEYIRYFKSLVESKESWLNLSSEIVPHLSLTASYLGLLNEKTGPKRVGFFDWKSKDLIYPRNSESFDCRCWICLSENPVKQSDNRSECRCDRCFALLGMPEDATTAI